ncbi:MAG: hypothetical protein ABH885_02595 [Candidatus Omnitrophota bacterium]
MFFDFLFGKKRTEAELGEPIGEVTHYFPHVKVGVVKIKKGSLSAGDTVYLKGHTTDFEEKIGSMQVNHRNVDKASKGQEIGVKMKHRVRKGDLVYKLS